MLPLVAVARKSQNCFHQPGTGLPAHDTDDPGSLPTARVIPMRAVPTISTVNVTASTGSPQIFFAPAASRISNCRSIRGFCRPSAAPATPMRLSLPGPGQSHGSQRVVTRSGLIWSSSVMSSGRLILDRLGRHQRPSPLHRQAQTNTHFSEALQNRTLLLCGDTNMRQS